jgi:hypothetical protein
MVNSGRLFCLSGVIVLSGCAVVSHERADEDAVAKSGVSPAIYQKIVHGATLSVEDIIGLKRAGVSDGIITRYIDDHTLVYRLSPADDARLRSAGISSEVITYMHETPHHNWPYPQAGPYLTPFGG